MDNTLLSQILQSLKYLVDDFGGLPFLHRPLPFDRRFEVPVADLSNNVAVIRAGEDFVAAKDIGMIKGLHDVNFGVQKVNQRRCLDAAQLYDLNRHRIVYISQSLLVNSLTPRYTLLKFPLPRSSLSLKV